MLALLLPVDCPKVLLLLGLDSFPVVVVLLPVLGVDRPTMPQEEYLLQLLPNES